MTLLFFLLIWISYNKQQGKEVDYLVSKEIIAKVLNFEKIGFDWEKAVCWFVFRLTNTNLQM